MADKIRQLQKELGTIIKGKKEVTDKIIMAVLARGHVLLEDVPGVGKTTTALALCRLMGMDFNRIQFTPDVVPSDVTGFTMYEKQTGKFIYRPGAVMCNMLLADEINRTSPKTQSALLEVMERHPEVYLKLVGVLDESGMDPVQNRIEKLPFMDWRQLPGVIAGLDINLMPLENTLFHCCKSENKWTEAALVKVPSVMSRNREMEYVIENGKDGWMCTTKEEWVSALESLVTDEKARKAMGEAAHQKVMEHYLTENTGKDAMEELLCSESYTK